VDPIAAQRWEFLPAWIAPSPVTPRAALAALDRAAEDSPVFFARRAVLLRLLAREDEALAALDRARALRPDGALDDPDALLTAAWLAARRSQYAPAVAAALRALPRMRAAAYREPLVLEVARWSLARGPEGLDDARSLVEALRRAGLFSPRAMATAALISARAGDLEDARLIARAAHVSLSASLAEPVGADRQSASFGELLNAVGVALLLDGRAAEAAPLLRRAMDQTPPPWRLFQQRMLDQCGAPPR
jgi:tetratricopeptide (TPR) repeat protein